MNSPSGESRGGTPAGERARKRRAAQAALSLVRTARRLRAGHETLRLPAFRFLFLSFLLFRPFLSVVMAGLVPAIHAFGRQERRKTWMPAT
jgi:hypothetical protein